MGSNNVVSIRVEALGVSITIADGKIAIEQTKTELPAVSKAEGSRHGLTGLQGDSGKGQETPAAAKRQSLPEPLPEGIDNGAVRGDSGAPNSTPVIDKLHRPPPPGSNGPTELPGDAGKDQEVRSDQTKWSDEEVETLRALYPTHSASVIAGQLGRRLNAVKSKVQNLGLKKDGPPTVTSKPAKTAPKPKPLSAAVTADSVLTALPGFSREDAGLAGSPGFSAVSLLDHHLGQCRWIVSDVWPVMYCGAPVVDCSSWCEQHSRRVFNLRPQGVSLYRLSKIFR